MMNQHTYQDRHMIPFWPIIGGFLVFFSRIAFGNTDAADRDRFPLLQHSPYFIPAVSSVPFPFVDITSKDEKVGGSGSFRVLGGVTDGLELNYVQAEEACRRVPGGIGLAIINTAQRKIAIDKALTHTRVSCRFLDLHTRCNRLRVQQCNCTHAQDDFHRRPCHALKHDQPQQLGIKRSTLWADVRLLACK